MPKEEGGNDYENWYKKNNINEEKQREAFRESPRRKQAEEKQMISDRNQERMQVLKINMNYEER